jgi:hypothetical protein
LNILNNKNLLKINIIGLVYSIGGNILFRDDDDKDFVIKKSQRILFGLSSA